ncbi:hypothetical protein WCP94_004313 [Bilophila wadsworthia]
MVFSFAHPTPATAHPAAAFFHALSKLFSAWPGKRAFLLGKKKKNYSNFLLTTN